LTAIPEGEPLTTTEPQAGPEPEVKDPYRPGVGDTEIIGKRILKDPGLADLAGRLAAPLTPVNVPESTARAAFTDLHEKRTGQFTDLARELSADLQKAMDHAFERPPGPGSSFVHAPVTAPQDLPRYMAPGETRLAQAGINALTTGGIGDGPDTLIGTEIIPLIGEPPISGMSGTEWAREGRRQDPGAPG